MYAARHHTESMRKQALLFAVITFMLLAVPVISGQGLAVIRVSSLTIPLNSDATIDVYVDCGRAVCTAFNIQLAYDPSILTISTLTPGGRLGTDTLLVKSEINSESGELVWTSVTIGAAQADPDVPLFLMSVTARAVGQMQFTATRVEVGDVSPLFTALRGGVINVVAALPTIPTEMPAVEHETPTTTHPAQMNVRLSRPTSLRAGLAFPSIWEGLTFEDISDPAMVEYRRGVDSQQTYRWVFTWCATAPIVIEEIYPNVSVNLRVNGYEQSSILEYAVPRCRGWMTTLSDWTPGSVVNLDIVFTVSRATYDGTKTYQPGEYVHRIIVNVP